MWPVELDVGELTRDPSEREWPLHRAGRRRAPITGMLWLPDSVLDLKDPELAQRLLPVVAGNVIAT